MVLTDAIKTARTEHVVYFLLAAYVETLDYFDPLRSLLPDNVKKLPVHGKTDVVERLRALCATAHDHARLRQRARLLLDEAVAVFTAASQRLWALQNTNQESGIQESVAGRGAVHAQNSAVGTRPCLLGERRSKRDFSGTQARQIATHSGTGISWSAASTATKDAIDSAGA